MPQVRAIPAIVPTPPAGSGVISSRIAPPYDVLDAASKADLLARDGRNIVAIDLPHTPAKTVGPQEAYDRAGQTYRQWLSDGTLTRLDKPAIFIYQQTFTFAPPGGQARTFKRRGVFVNVGVQGFGPGPEGVGGIYPHEQTFAAAKEDRLKLMHATRCQLSPIFGLYDDPDRLISRMLEQVCAGGRPDRTGQTPDGVTHELWTVDLPARVNRYLDLLKGKDVFIADGHHRYNTALNYRAELGVEREADHPANFCLFVLIAMQDEGMVVGPTHRVLGGMKGFSIQAFAEAARGHLLITPYFGESLAELERALHQSGAAMGGHAIGLYCPTDDASMAIISTIHPDPLAPTHAQRHPSWRQLDVAIVQHLIVEQVCGPSFTDNGSVAWKFPHTLEQLQQMTHEGGYDAGLILRPIALEQVRAVSLAGELMPHKSTFFYPKLATGLVLNPLA